MGLSSKSPQRGQGAWTAGAVCAALAVLAAGCGAARAADEPVTTGGDAIVRRISPDQYQQIVSDVFGDNIKLGGRFEPDVRAGGLLAVGAGKVSVTATGLEQYDALARSVATQVVDPAHRNLLIPCKPASETEADDKCAAQFLGAAGRLLYRRPMTQAELQTQVGAAAAATKTLKSFYTGLGLSLAGMLEAPQFLFRQETVEPDPAHSGQYRMDAYTKASQLSFFMWNAAPDPELLAAAEKGELNNAKGLERQVDRLVASRRLEGGVRAFFTDMLGFEEFDTLSKDAAIYPQYTPDVARDAREQTLRTIVDLLVNRRGDYRDLYTTRKTFLTPVLGSVYGLPIVKDTPNGAPEAWTAYEFSEGDPRGVGILGQVSFVALHSHPGRSSPTIRGKALREVLLCQKVPDPPGNVNFTVVQDTKNPQFKTARERLTAHRTDPTCAGCHKLIDPMGLALENFDSSGGYRTAENGSKIDPSGEFDGMKFTDAAGLGKAMHDHPATPSCLVNRVYAYAAGRVPTKDEGPFLKYLEKDFAAGGYKVPDLMRRIATSDAFYRVTAPQTGALDGTPTKFASDTQRH